MSHVTQTNFASPEPKAAANTPDVAIPQQITAPGRATMPSNLTAAFGRTIKAATAQQARAVGLTILAEARWPESADDQTPPNLPGFIISSFSPLVAETAARCLGRRAEAEGESLVTAVLIATTRGDRQSAAHVAKTVAGDGVLGPLLFFQSVPNAVAGHIAARWNLTGPVVCLADPASALEAAALLIEDGDADEALLIHVEQGDRDQAHAVLLRAAAATATTAPATAAAPDRAAPAPAAPELATPESGARA